MNTNKTVNSILNLPVPRNSAAQYRSSTGILRNRPYFAADITDQCLLEEAPTYLDEFGANNHSFTLLLLRDNVSTHTVQCIVASDHLVWARDVTGIALTRLRPYFLSKCIMDSMTCLDFTMALTLSGLWALIVRAHDFTSLHIINGRTGMVREHHVYTISEFGNTIFLDQDNS
jgi:hypothetical protein